MSTAIIAVTKAGTELALRLAAHLAGAHVYAKYPGEDQAVRPFASLSGLVSTLFSSYQQLIFIMAVGIVARVTAPYIHDKRTDPAVVVVDEGSRHAISFLSGHIGGANELTLKVASLIGARPVITTATDVAGKPAPDVLAVKLDAQIEPFSNLKKVNAKIVNGGVVEYFLDNSLPAAARYRQTAQAMGISCNDLTGIRAGGYDAAVVITDKLYALTAPHIFLRPPTLAVGIGCRRGTAKASVLQAINEACSLAGRSAGSIAVIASAVVKRDEAGLIAAAEELGAALRFFTNAELQHCIDNHNLPISQFVSDTIGVGNVCQASALLAANAKAVILSKTKLGPVTVSIAPIQS